MKLDDFEYYAEGIVLDRGKELFKKGAVAHKDNSGVNGYFEVKGTKLYHIVICLHKNLTINFESCSCPYSKRGHLCKHTIACLYYIRQKLNVSKETMFSKFLEKNPYLVAEKDYLKITKKFLQSVFKRIRHEGFIEYSDMVEFEIAIDEVIDYMRKSKEILKDKSLIFDICMFLINTISKTKYNCDDSNGEIVNSFYTTTDFMEQVFESPDNELFSKLYKELTNSKNEYDIEFEKLTEMALNFANNDIDKQRIKKLRKDAGIV